MWGTGTGGRGASLRALEELYARDYPRYLRVAWAITGEREAAADAVQEAFARAIRERERFRGDGPLEGWVWRAVVRVALDEHRRREAPTAEIVAEATLGDEHGVWADLRLGIAALPERQRTVLFLRHYADLTYEQIADVLVVQRGTVAATLNAAHNSLRARLTEVTR